MEDPTLTKSVILYPRVQPSQTEEVEDVKTLQTSQLIALLSHPASARSYRYPEAVLSAAAKELDRRVPAPPPRDR